MLNFEEELKRFQPSPEVEEVEEIIDRENSLDVTDIINDIMKDKINR